MPLCPDGVSIQTISPGIDDTLRITNAAVLSIPGGYVYSYEDDVIISDEKNVYNVGGCGERMSGWSLVDVADGVQEWESPELLKDTFHRFASLAVLVHRWGFSYYHWVLEALPRLLMYLEHVEGAKVGVSGGDRGDGAVGSAHTPMRLLVYREKFVRETIRLLGLSENRQTVFFEPNAVYFADTLHVATAPPCGRRHGPRCTLRGIICRGGSTHFLVQMQGGVKESGMLAYRRK